MAILTSAITKAAKANPRLYWTVRSTRLLAGSHLPPRADLPGVPGRVHRNDLMFNPGHADPAADYAQAGEEPVRFVSASITGDGGNFEAVKDVLDFGCGHGRVLRFLRQALPDAAITACDLDLEAAMFCATEFGAAALVSTLETNELRLSDYGLIWIGSVLTHVDEATARNILSHLVDALEPHGYLAFSTHGEYSLAHAPALLQGAGALGIADEVKRRGISYRAYSHYGRSDYGLTWHSADYIRDIPGRFSVALVLVAHSPNAWGEGHQDLWLFRKSDTATPSDK